MWKFILPNSVMSTRPPSTCRVLEDAQQVSIAAPPRTQQTSWSARSLHHQSEHLRVRPRPLASSRLLASFLAVAEGGLIAGQATTPGMNQVANSPKLKYGHIAGISLPSRSRNLDQERKRRYRGPAMQNAATWATPENPISSAAARGATLVLRR